MIGAERASVDFSSETGEAVVFAVGDIISGLNISHVREICKNLDITRVYRSPDFIRGVINLRGQVVTVVDVRTIFGMPPVDLHRDMRIIIVRWQAEEIGLLVDAVHDIVEVEAEGLEPPPSNVRGVAGSLFNGIYKRPNSLVSLLHLEETLKFKADARMP